MKIINCFFSKKIILVFILISNLLAANDRKNTVKDVERNSIKEISIWDYKLKLGVQEEFGREVERNSFDSLGNLIETVSFLYDGNVDARKVYLYDSSGVLLEKISLQTYYDENDSIQMYREDSVVFLIEDDSHEAQTRMHFVMDSRKQKLDSLAMKGFAPYFYGSSIAITDYFYDDSGSIVEKTLRKTDYTKNDSVTMEYIDSLEILAVELGFDVDKQPVLKNTFQYDEEGNLQEDVTFLNNEKIHFRAYKYDTKNRCSEKVFFDAQGAALVKYEFRFNNFGKPSEIIVYNNNGNISGKYFKKYDGKRNETESSFLYTNRFVHSKILRTYNNSGKILTEERYQEGKFEYKGVYSYDKRGRKSEQKIFLTEIKSPKMLRKFRYEMWGK